MATRKSSTKSSGQISCQICISTSWRLASTCLVNCKENSRQGAITANARLPRSTRYATHKAKSMPSESLREFRWLRGPRGPRMRDLRWNSSHRRAADGEYCDKLAIPNRRGIRTYDKRHCGTPNGRLRPVQAHTIQVTRHRLIDTLPHSRILLSYTCMVTDEEAFRPGRV